MDAALRCAPSGQRVGRCALLGEGRRTQSDRIVQRSRQCHGRCEGAGKEGDEDYLRFDRQCGFVAWRDLRRRRGCRRRFLFLRARRRRKWRSCWCMGRRYFQLQGTYDEAWELCMQASAEFGWYNRNCAINPYLIEGKKTVSLELAEQFMRLRRGVFPTGLWCLWATDARLAACGRDCGRCTCSASFPACHELLGVQAEGCKPFLTAWQDKCDLVPCEAHTLADSIAVGHPRNFVKGMSAVTESGGAFVSVSDEEILQSIPMLARKAGVFGEPAGVAGAAGVKRAVESGIIGRSESVAIIMTGNGLKDIQSAMRAVGRPISVRPEMEEVRKAVDAQLQRWRLTRFAQERESEKCEDGKDSVWSQLTMRCSIRAFSTRMCAPRALTAL